MTVRRVTLALTHFANSTPGRSPSPTASVRPQGVKMLEHDIPPLDAHQIGVITRQALPDPIAAFAVEPDKPVEQPPRGAVSMHSRLLIGGILWPMLPLGTINTSS